MVCSLVFSCAALAEKALLRGPLTHCLEAAMSDLALCDQGRATETPNVPLKSQQRILEKRFRAGKHLFPQQGQQRPSAELDA
jgi:hypothetical protein